MVTDVIAIDLGNESGRVMNIHFDGEQLDVSEVYRFPNNPVTVAGTLTWDVLRLWHEIQIGLELALKQPVSGIAVDSFGVDFGLLDGRGHLITNPIHMRDSRTDGMMEWVHGRISREILFERTGIGFYSINTLYQLNAIQQTAPWQLEAARTLLTMPNLFNYWLTGEKLSEFTHSTTTQCFDWRAGDWDRETLQALDIPTHMLPPIVYPGAKVGSYRDVSVFAVASHDTGSAVAAIPTETVNYVYISSGTWSLVGLETRRPLTNADALRANITSEGGAFGTYRPLKLVMGLWLMQQCRATWQAAGIDISYENLLSEASHAPAFVSFIDPDDPVFLPPGDMPARVRDFCQRSRQPVPVTIGAIMRCVMESLALKYRYVIEQLITASDHPVEVIHVVGGGSQNPLLCQMTADAVGRPVLAGPVEAAALGNGLVQLIALGEVRDLAEGRSIVRVNHRPTRYEPQDRLGWDAAYQRFQTLITTP